MGADDSKTLYSNVTRDVFFLIPDGDIDGLTEGNLLLRGMLGQRIDVDPRAVARYEVDEAVAKGIVQAALGEVASRARAVLEGAGRTLEEAQQAARDGVTPDNAAAARVAELLGQTPEELRSTPGVVVEFLKKALERIGEQVQEGVEPTEEERQKIREDLQTVADVTVGQIQAEGHAAAAEAVEKLRAVLGDPALAARLRAATNRVRAASVLSGPPTSAPNPSEDDN